MKRRAITYALLTVAFLVVGFSSYRLGLKSGASQARESFGAVLASVQADLGVTKLQRLRVLETDLARGCSKEALAKVRFDIDLQLYVLSTLYHDHRGTWVAEGIVKRDPTMPSQLEGFNKRFASTWTEPKCAA